MTGSSSHDSRSGVDVSLNYDRQHRQNIQLDVWIGIAVGHPPHLAPGVPTCDYLASWSMIKMLGPLTM